MADTKHTEDCAIHGCEGWNGTRYCDCGAETKQDAERQRLQEYDVRPFDKLPDSHADHVNQWLASNKKKPAEVRWSLYPIGMVGRWIERAETAEARAAQELRPQGEWKSLFHDLWGMWHEGVAYDQQIKDKLGKLLFLLTARPAGGELREAFEAKARERAGFAEHDLHQTLPGIYDGMLVRAAWEGCIFGVAFAASERPRPSDELTHAVGKLLKSEGEDFRLKHPELLDAYHAASERGHGGCANCSDHGLCACNCHVAPPAEKGEGR